MPPAPACPSSSAFARRVTKPAATCIAKPARLGGNLGRTTLHPRRLTRDPMAAFDALPPPLRVWVTQAALPWSAASCLRIWRRMRARGAPITETLAALDRAEAAALKRAQGDS